VATTLRSSSIEFAPGRLPPEAPTRSTDRVLVASALPSGARYRHNGRSEHAERHDRSPGHVRRHAAQVASRRPQRNGGNLKAWLIGTHHGFALRFHCEPEEDLAMMSP
jgi:hypothetical protein